MRKLLAVSALAGLLTVGCASSGNRGGTYEHTSSAWGTGSSAAMEAVGASCSKCGQSLQANETTDNWNANATQTAAASGYDNDTRRDSLIEPAYNDNVTDSRRADK